jgi:hypothetical protein
MVVFRQQGASGIYSRATITVDATNITLAWVRENDVSLTAQFMWEVQ